MTSLSTPAAIVIGLSIAGAFAGVGLFLGLRPRGPASNDAALAERATASAPAAPLTTVPASSATGSAPPAVDPKSAHGRALADARRGVEAEHAKLVRDCWEPSPAAKAATAPVVMTFMLGYGEDGHPISRALRTNGMNVPADVAGCVNREAAAPDITPLGVGTRVDVEIKFP